MRRPRKLDELTVLPDWTFARAGAVPVRVTARVVRSDTGAPLRDGVHFSVSQRGLDHFWEPRSGPSGRYGFEPAILRPGATWFTVWRNCFTPTVVRTRIEANGHVRLGTVRLAPERAAPGTIGVLLATYVTPRGPTVEVEAILEEGPAERAGLQLGDLLLEIDGCSFVPEDAERLLRGPPGTKVQVKVRRPLERRNGDLRHVRPRTLTITIVRAPGRRTRRRHPIWRA